MIGGGEAAEAALAGSAAGGAVEFGSGDAVGGTVPGAVGITGAVGIGFAVAAGVSAGAPGLLSKCCRITPGSMPGACTLRCAKAKVSGITGSPLRAT